jgi:recombination protein RecA
MYGEGISKMGELIDLGVQANFVEKSGAWFSYDGQRIGQGRENAKQFMRDNPEIAAKLEAQIRQNVAGVAETMLKGSDLSEDSGTSDAASSNDDDEAPARTRKAR